MSVAPDLFGGCSSQGNWATSSEVEWVTCHLSSGAQISTYDQSARRCETTAPAHSHCGKAGQRKTLLQSLGKSRATHPCPFKCHQHVAR